MNRPNKTKSAVFKWCGLSPKDFRLLFIILYYISYAVSVQCENTCNTPPTGLTDICRYAYHFALYYFSCDFILYTY